MNVSVRAALLCAALLGAVGLIPQRVFAAHDDFRFKWPYKPGASVLVTGYPYTNHHGCPADADHSCTDAWDIVIADDDVRSSAEGLVYEIETDFLPHQCGSGLGLGNNVKVSVPNGPSVYYAHLVSVSVAANVRVLQGDQIGIQGDTGNTTDGMGGCGEHLHFQFVSPGRPSVIDGQSVANDVTNPGDSTNSEVGARPPVSGAPPWTAIRDLYFFFGTGPFGPSWGVVGWTADWTGSQGGCGWLIFCQFYVHYAPDPIVGHWGSAQTFRLHPGAAAVDDDSIMVARWAATDPYFVERGYFLTWLLNALVPGSDPPMYTSIGLPVMFKIDSSSGVNCGLVGQCCSSSVGCANFQRFHVGYIWQNTQGYYVTGYCPDVSSYYTDLDGRVTVADILAVNTIGYPHNDAGLQPYEPWYYSWYDIDGSGQVTVADIILVVKGFGKVCKAS